MKRIISILIVFISLASCKDDLTRMKKKNLIPKDTFVEILAGIHLADILSNGSEFTRKFEASDTVELNQFVFDKYHVTRAQFDSTVAMYTRQPEVFLKLYDEVQLKLNYMLDTLKNNEPQFSEQDAVEK